MGRGCGRSRGCRLWLELRAVALWAEAKLQSVVLRAEAALKAGWKCSSRRRHLGVVYVCIIDAHAPAGRGRTSAGRGCVLTLGLLDSFRQTKTRIHTNASTKVGGEIAVPRGFRRSAIARSERTRSTKQTLCRRAGTLQGHTGDIVRPCACAGGPFHDTRELSVGTRGPVSVTRHIARPYATALNLHL